MSKIQIIPAYSMAQYDVAIQELLIKAVTVCKDFQDRIDFFSQAFLDHPYLNGALGEGESAEFDQQPLYRTDYFDCLTYVNTVLALALSNNLEVFCRNILRLNYRDSRPLYENRYHFTSIDWNAAHEKSGLFSDITKTFEIPALLAETTIDRSNFFQHKNYQDIKRLQEISSNEAENILKKLHALGDVFSPEKSTVNYLPIQAILASQNTKERFQAQLPELTLAEMVRPNWDLREKIGTHLNISHLGFLFKRDNTLRFRHATVDLGKVVEIDFFEYLEKFKESPTLKGIYIAKFKRLRV
jgi:hypothetical protein